MYFQKLQYNIFSLSKSPYFYCFKSSTGVWVTWKVIYTIRKYDNTEHSITDLIMSANFAPTIWKKFPVIFCQLVLQTELLILVKQYFPKKP
jgi:hypothetical protein